MLFNFIGGLKVYLVAGLLIAAAVSCNQEQKPTKAELIKDVKAYIEKEQKQNDGYLELYDSVANRQLYLKLVKVHKDKFSHMGDSVYFICSDFKGKNGKKYDVDTFMKWDGNSFEAVNRKIHKVDDKPRYIWYEKDSIWMTKKPPKDEEPKMIDGHPAH